MPTDQALAEQHRYVTEHGREPAPGVTSIIGMLSIDGLQWGASKLTAEVAVLEAAERGNAMAEHWARLMADKRKKKTAAQMTPPEIEVDFLRTEFDRRWRAKADRGSRVHAHALAWSEGKPIKSLPDEDPYLDALFAFHQENKPTFFLSELVVLCPNPDGDAELEFGGRFDTIAKLNAGPHAGKLVMADYKTGKHYRESLALQFAGYSGCEGTAQYGSDGSLLKLNPMPMLDGHLGIYLGDDGSYSLEDPFEDIPQEWAWRTFLHARATLNFRRHIEALDKAAWKATR